MIIHVILTLQIFPTDENAAVCRFEAFINEKHVVAKVKEKEEAHREYQEAITQGKGAYLLDEGNDLIYLY